jgi:hypothetical protein
MARFTRLRHGTVTRSWSCSAATLRPWTRWSQPRTRSAALRGTGTPEAGGGRAQEAPLLPKLGAAHRQGLSGGSPRLQTLRWPTQGRCLHHRHPRHPPDPGPPRPEPGARSRSPARPGGPARRRARRRLGSVGRMGLTSRPEPAWPRPAEDLARAVSLLGNQGRMSRRQARPMPATRVRGLRPPAAPPSPVTFPRPQSSGPQKEIPIGLSVTVGRADASVLLAPARSDAVPLAHGRWRPAQALVRAPRREPRLADARRGRPAAGGP